MQIQYKREQYRLGRFQYRVWTDAIETVISFQKTHGMGIQVRSENMEQFQEMKLHTFFGSKIKQASITKREAGYFVLQDGERGLIYYCTKKGSNFLNGIYFWSFEIANVTYTAYEVGFGRKGIYYCIYENDAILVAIFDKDLHNKHFESEGTVYARNEMRLEMLSLCAIFWDLTRYYPSDSSSEWYTLNTWQKELKNKYDPNFIPMIMQMESPEGRTYEQI